MSERAPLSMLPLFAGPAPSVPNPTSEAAADAILHSPMRRKSCRAILLTLAATDRLMSMADLSVATDIPINVICARLADLRPMYVETHPGACESRAKKGLHVDGLSLSKQGREYVRKATTEDIRHG